MGREIRKTLCVLMAAITLSSSIELPVRASESVGEVQEAADSEEAVLESAEMAEETARNAQESDPENDITMEETDSGEAVSTEVLTAEEEERSATDEEFDSAEEMPVGGENGSETSGAAEETTSTEERTSTEEELTEELISSEDNTQEETEEEGIAPHIYDFVEINDIARGNYKNIYWRIDKNGKLTVKGAGEYCASPQHTSSPWYPYRESIKTAVVNVRFIQNPSFMFEDCVNLTSVEISELDTSLSTNFAAMFSGCKSLKSVDLSSMDTSNALKLNSMFYNCSSLEELDLSNLNTGKVTNMERMFAGAVNLKHIQFGKTFTTVNVTCSSYMFQSCTALEELDLSGFSMPNNTQMEAMFESCQNLRQLTFGENFSAANVTNVKDMFCGCNSLSTLDLSTFDLGRAQITERMLGSWMPLLALHTPRNVKVDINMPGGIWQTPTGQCITNGYMPKNQSRSMKLTQQMHLEVKKTVTEYCYGSTLDLSDLKVEWRNSTGSIKEQVKDYTTNARNIDMKTAGAKNLIVTYKGLTAVVQITVKAQTIVDRWVLEDAQTVYMPGEKPNLDGIWLHCYLGGVSKILTKNYRTNAHEIDMSTPGVKKLKVWYEDASGEVDLFVMEPFQDDDIAHKRYDSFAYRIDKNGKLTMMGSTPRDKSTDWRRSQDVLDSIKTAKVVIRGADNFSELLYGCHNLEHVDFSETETRYVENFSLMFYECYKLKSVDLSGFDTRNARSMSFMFGACKSLKHVDLSGFRTENVHLMSRMFYKCEALEHIDLSSFDTRNVNSMSEMFYECRSLTSVNLDSLDTRNVKDLPNMFYCCTKLKKLNLANFDLGSATDADSLVGDCKELEELWTPRNVKVAASLGGTWYDDKDNAYTEFPRNRSDSVHLSKQRKTQEQEPEESSTGEESSSGEERSDPAESSSSEESSSNEESSPNKESSSNKESSPNDESASGEGSSDAEESSSGAESSDIAESSSVEESSDVEESSSVEESSDVEESSSVEESSEIEESSSIEESSDSAEGSTSEESSDAEESSSGAESSVPAESSSAEESNDPAESSPNEESSTVEESSSIKESSAAEESESVEESMSSDDHTSSEEASSSEETSSIEESPSDEESASGEESGSEAESSPYTDKERIDLQKAGGKISAIKTKTYDGLAYTPSVKVTVTEGSSRRTLTEGTDYSVIYQQNTDAGQGTAIVRGNGLYKGTLQTTFEITPKSIKKLKIITGSMTTDSQSELPVYVYDGTKSLENGKDYQLTFAGDLTAKASKTAKVTVTAAGNYEGSSTVKLTVYEEDASHIINPEHVTLQAESVPYTGKAYKPALTVKIDGTALRANKDYKVQYQNNKNAGTAYVVVTGKGAYKGKAVKIFEITARSKTEASLTISKISDKTYNGKYQKPSVTVRCGKKKLVKNKDYIITYERNLHASANNQKAQVTITGIGNYEGVVETAEFVIKPQKISKAAVKGTHENLTLTYGSNKLKEGVHYTVTSDASGARSGGKKMNIKIKGLGDFAGSEMTKSVKVQ